MGRVCVSIIRSKGGVNKMNIKNWVSQYLAAGIGLRVLAVWIFILSFIFISAVLSSPANAASENQKNVKVPPEVEKSKPYQRWKWFFEQRAYPTGVIPAGANARALKQIKEAKEKASKGPKSSTVSGASTSLSSAAGSLTAIAGDRWIPIGPSPIDSGPQWGDVSGRVSDIEVDRADPNHWFVAFASGGLWETRDAGATWISKTDSEATQTIGAIAMAPSNPNIIYVGTGDPVSWMSLAGEGLLKSIDGGNTWQLLAAAEFSKANFIKIQVDPTNPDILVASATPHGSGDYTYSGILKSTDGGVTWRRVLPSNQADDLEVNPTNFNQQYATGYIPGVGLSTYRSNDSGETWVQISGPWDDGQTGYIKMAIAPSNPNVMYVSAVGGVSMGIWRTDNAWSAVPTWTQVVSAAGGGQWWYNHTITVDPSDPLTAYFGGVPLSRINGNTISFIGDNIHVDQHSLAWAGNRLIVGNDGGVYSSANPNAATPTWNNHNAGLSTVIFYHGSLHPQNAGFALGGSQDNGTGKWASSNKWQQIYCCDGMDNAISSTNPDAHWAVSIQGLGIYRTVNGGQSITWGTSGIDLTNAPFFTLFEKCPSNDDVFLTSGIALLYRTNNFFNSEMPQWSVNNSEMAAHAIAFASATGNCNTYVTGISNVLRLTTDGGNTWADIGNGNMLPGRYITDIAFDPRNANIMYVTFSGYDENSWLPGHVFKTANGLSATPTWTNISPPVNTPHNTIIVDPNDTNTLYVGTDLGVWKSMDAGTNWSHMGPETGMPNVEVTELQVSGNTGKIVAFTYGRSAFMLASSVDLVTTAVILPPPAVVPGTLTTLGDTVCNQGYDATAGFNVNYYLSSDAQITTADTYIGTRSVAGLAANSCNSGSIAWTSVAGSYYIGVIADANNAVSEANENNNTLAKNYTPPTVTTNPANSITETCATLNGTIVPNNSYANVWFEWGSTTAYGNKTDVQTLGGDATAIPFAQQVCSLTARTTYHFRAVGQNAATVSYGGDITLKTLTKSAPTAPTNLTAVAKAANQIDISWTASTDNVGVAFYDVEACYGSSKCSYFYGVATGVTETNYSMWWLNPSTTYQFRVSATDVDGNVSRYSNIATATTPADTQPPTPPTNLTATTAGMTQIYLSWIISTDDVGVAQYAIERCLLSSCTYFPITEWSSNYYDNYSDMGLIPRTSYSYRVQAMDAAGNKSDFSNVASATTQPDPESPTAPTGLVASPISSSQINLAWNASTDNVGVTGYSIERCLVLSCMYAQIGTATETGYSDTGLPPGTDYSYRVRAYDVSVNNSDYSAPASATTLIVDTQAPTTPTNLTATAVSKSQVNLTWTASTDDVGVTGYEIERCTGLTCTNFSLLTTVTGTSYSNTGLTGLTAYRYHVRAFDAAGNKSDFSSIATVSTPKR